MCVAAQPTACVLVQFHVHQVLVARLQNVYSLTPYLKNTIAVDKQVARFDISMKNPGRVEILETYRQKQYFILLV
jgi:hypothetical protein